MSTALWTPSQEYIEQSELYCFKQFIEKKYECKFKTYDELQHWSIQHIGLFWENILEYFDIIYTGNYEKVLDWNPNSTDFMDAKWFEGISLNYVEHIFKNSNSANPALKFASETVSYKEVSWEELQRLVSKIQQYLIDVGIKKGDRVVGVLNNTIETIAIFLAVNSLGAIWSCCSPDFGDVSIKERFAQIEPKLLFIETTYQYNNRQFSKSETLALLQKDLSSLIDVVEVYSDKWKSIFERYPSKEITFTKVPFSHPIWILYSSGTTGKPKAITHSTGGNLLEHYKALALHQNVQKGENFLWYTTTGWMMWNYAISSLLCGATLCLFDGIINHKRHYTFWNFLRRANVHHLGAGAVYFSALKQFSIKGYAPKVIGSTGSPLPNVTFEFLQQKFPNTHIVSLSGGTDVCSAFLSGSTLLPVFAGQLQCRTLGSAISAYNDEGKAVFDEVGELVIERPMPSMPLYFWNDTKNEKYKSSYFEHFKNVWSHGDWIKISKTEGITIYGRSDATLNRGGVRIGTAEIYNAVNSLSAVEDSLVITVDKEDGSSKMLLFIKKEVDFPFSEELKQEIKDVLRKQYSPRHVPDKIFEVSDIPYTLSGKKLELPVKKIFSGSSIDKAVSKDIMRNPNCLEEYLTIFITFNSYNLH